VSPSLEELILENGWQVPDFVINWERERRTKYAIVIPVINEGERIRNQLREMNEQEYLSKIDTIIADGGSSDGSLDIEFLAQLGVRGLLTKTGPGKLSAQLRCAYAWTLLEGYEGIITIDGNGKDGVEAIPAFVSALDDGYGYAQASRFIKGGSEQNTPLQRKLAIRLIHAPLQSLAARYWFTDTTQGFRSYSRQYLMDERTAPFRDVFSKYELLAYLTARASQLGYRVKEIPTRRDYPSNAPTPTKISGIGPLIEIVLVALRVLIGAYNPSRK